MSPASGGVSPAQVDAVMRAARVLTEIAALSVAEVDDVVTLPQLRVLITVGTHGPMNLGSVAAGLDVSAPNASRICDRLLRAGLLDRRADLADRRNIMLSLTADGRAVVDKVTRHRRAAIRRTLRNMDAGDREQLATAMERFVRAAGVPVDGVLVTPS